MVRVEDSEGDIDDSAVGDSGDTEASVADGSALETRSMSSAADVTDLAETPAGFALDCNSLNSLKTKVSLDRFAVDFRCPSKPLGSSMF